MDRQRTAGWNRRELLRGTMVVGTAGLLGLLAPPVAAGPPPETTKLRLIREPTICLAPQYVAEELLLGEGFTDVRYISLREVFRPDGLWQLASPTSSWKPRRC
jgi:hypothetical protein